MRYNQAYYSVYDLAGDLEFVGNWQGQIAEHLQVNERTVWRTLKDGRKLIANHVVIKYDAEKDIQKHIELEKIPPKFKDTDKRYKRKYLAYDRQGNLVFGPIFLSEMIKELGVHKDTILDGIVKNHLASGHIIRLLNSKKFIPKRLSPHAKEFNLYQYDRKGDLVNWFTNMSTASRITGINYTVITNCIIKHVSTDAQYYFTDHIPLLGYKNITVKFKLKTKPLRVYVSHDGKREEMSLNQACSYIGTSYATLKRKVKAESHVLFKGYLIEAIPQNKEQEKETLFSL
jgi:hypothetical protein